MRIGVIGAGHAGVEAAWQASNRGTQVVLFSSESVLPYARPRVVALAFGRTELESIYQRPERWYREHGIDLRLNAEVTQVNACARSVTTGWHPQAPAWGWSASCGTKPSPSPSDLRPPPEEHFDALIVATGATPALLPFLQEFPDDVIPLWGVRESLTIRERLRHTRQLVILGGGISGVESALYARQAGLGVTMVEKMDRPMSLQFGVKAGAVLIRRLQKAGVQVLTGRHATAVAKRDGRLVVALDDKTELPCDLIITTAGTTRKLALFARAGLQVDKGILVDEHLQTSVPGVFACGDIAKRGSVRTATVLRASQQGRCAGGNVISFLQSQELACTPEPVAPLLFKHADLELQSIGPSAGENLEERVLSNDGETVYRSVLLENGLLRGVQMVGSHEGFRQLVDSLGRPWEALDRGRGI